MIPIRDTSVARGFAPATAIIIFTNLVIFVEELRVGDQIFQLFSVSPLDVYRYLTEGLGNIVAINWHILVSAFMHGGYIHLIGNMIFLSVFGPALEKKIGKLRYVLFYFGAAFAAFYVHTAVFPTSPVPVVGASGAIAGVMGAYLIFNPKAKVLTILPLLFYIEVIEIPSVAFILVWFLLQGANGFLSVHNHANVAWFSHIGGFVTGFIAGIQMKWFQ